MPKGRPAEPESVARRVLAGLAYRSLTVAASGTRSKHISAMVRVRNEEEFLYPSVTSIASLVDEIVVVDNLSTDRTPAIIDTLQREHAAKLRRYVYPFEIRRVGAESAEGAAAHASSPQLSANYYNWCLRRCTRPYVLKWDGDMIATEGFREALEDWRRTEKVVMVFHGANVHPDRRHLLAARTGDRDALVSTLALPMIPAWLTSMAYDYPEPRLFPRFRARYDSSLGWTQRLRSPFLHRVFGSSCCYRVSEPSFLHLKFCKREPYSNYSPDLREVIAANVVVGTPLRPEWDTLLRRWQIGTPLA